MNKVPCWVIPGITILAAELAMTAADSRLTPLLALAQHYQIQTIVGAPLQNRTARPGLGAILITAEGDVKTYAKMHLGDSEKAFFSPGDTPLAFRISSHTVGIAVCADASQTAHPQAYADLGANIYAASRPD